MNITDSADDVILASDINTIDGSATGTIVIDNQIVLKGNSDVVQTALAAVTNTGQAKITLDDAHTLAELKAINNATDGAITFNTKTVALTGSAADVKAALTGVTGYTGNITLNTDHDLAGLKVINNAQTSGTLTLNTKTVALTGSASDVSAALTGVTSYTGCLLYTSQRPRYGFTSRMPSYD